MLEGVLIFWVYGMASEFVFLFGISWVLAVIVAFYTAM